jgi:hypothetical protein
MDRVIACEYPTNLQASDRALAHDGWYARVDSQPESRFTRRPNAT